jgi:hypothetical protein
VTKLSGGLKMAEDIFPALLERLRAEFTEVLEHLQKGRDIMRAQNNKEELTRYRTRHKELLRYHLRQFKGKI